MEQKWGYELIQTYNLSGENGLKILQFLMTEISRQEKAEGESVCLI